MTVARRPRRIRKVMRPLLQWYYNLNLLVPSFDDCHPSVLFRCVLSSLRSVARSVRPFVRVRMCERALSAYVSRPSLLLPPALHLPRLMRSSTTSSLHASLRVPSLPPTRPPLTPAAPPSCGRCHRARVFVNPTNRVPGMQPIMQLVALLASCVIGSSLRVHPACSSTDSRSVAFSLRPRFLFWFTGSREKSWLRIFKRFRAYARLRLAAFPYNL